MGGNRTRHPVQIIYHYSRRNKAALYGSRGDAGLADREFQAVHNQDRELAAHARELVLLSGDLTGVEITPKVLKLFLDKKLGPDDRISDWSYDWTTRLVKSLGFRDLKQLDTAIAQYDDGELCSIAHTTRQGQLTRFELMLLAALGVHYMERHPWKTSAWFGPFQTLTLANFQKRGIAISTFDPLAESAPIAKRLKMLARSRRPAPILKCDLVSSVVALRQRNPNDGRSAIIGRIVASLLSSMV